MREGDHCLELLSIDGMYAAQNKLVAAPSASRANQRTDLEDPSRSTCTVPDTVTTIRHTGGEPAAAVCAGHIAHCSAAATPLGYVSRRTHVLRCKNHTCVRRPYICRAPRVREISHTRGGEGFSADTPTSMLPGMPGSARCVRRFDDSLGSASRKTYRISLRSSSLREPRYPSLKVIFAFDVVGEEERELQKLSPPHSPQFQLSS
jgi:hypothetical protein